MTLIDQRILIPAPMQAVWEVIADHRQLPQWRADVATVSMLSTRPDISGTRRRITPKNSHKDIIEEIRVWYAGVGYEYTIIEGNPFKSFVSRIRLQATPDGTIVQWTISYELGGILKRIFSGRRRRRQLERLTAESLRALRRRLEGMGIQLDQQYRDKTRIQEAPDADSRAEYGAKLIATQPEKATAVPDNPAIEEPPIKLEDTPSVPRVIPPSFLVDALTPAQETPAGDSDTQPRPSIEIEEPLPTEDDTRPRTAIAEPDAEEIDSPAPATPVIVDEEEEEDDPEVYSDLPPPTGKRDTGQISIWDVFGMDRPKDELTTIIDELKTGEHPVVSVEDEDSEQPEETVDPEQLFPGVNPAPQAALDNPKTGLTALDRWLAEDEPPIPGSASSTIKTIVRPPKSKRRGGLRQMAKQRGLRIRRPRRRQK